MPSWRPSQFMSVFILIIFVGWGSYVAWALNLQSEIRALEEAHIQNLQSAPQPSSQEPTSSYDSPDGSLLAEASHTVREAFSDMFDSSGGSEERLVEIIDLNTGEKTVFEDSSEPTSQNSFQEPLLSNAPAFTPCSFQTSSIPSFVPILINEVAWMGSMTSFNHEWIELENNSGAAIDISNWQLIDQGGQIAVYFGSGTLIPAGGFYLLERSTDEAVSNVSADFIYSGALSNEQEGLRLFDSQCGLRDEILASSSWPAGENDSKRTMERGNNLSWHTYSGEASGGIWGTPRRENSSQIAVSQSQSSPEPEPSSQPSSTTNTSSETPTSSEPAQTASSSPVVSPQITEIIFDVEGADEGKEYVKIQNSSSSPVDLSMYSLQYLSSSGDLSKIQKKNFENGVVIGGGAFFLVGMNCHTATPCENVQMSWSQSLNNTNGTLFLVSNQEKVVDITDIDIVDSLSYSAQ